jgi:hypothetical protein
MKAGHARRAGIDRAFSPHLRGRPHTQGVALGWYGAGPSALNPAPRQRRNPHPSKATPDTSTPTAHPVSAHRNPWFPRANGAQHTSPRQRPGFTPTRISRANGPTYSNAPCLRLGRAFSPQLWGRPIPRALPWAGMVPGLRPSIRLRGKGATRTRPRRRPTPPHQRRTLCRPIATPGFPAPTAHNIPAQGNALGSRPPAYRGPTARPIPTLRASDWVGPSALSFGDVQYPGRCPGLVWGRAFGPPSGSAPSHTPCATSTHAS